MDMPGFYRTQVLIGNVETIGCMETSVEPEQIAGPEIIKLFSCLTQLSIKFILLINIKITKIVGILKFISRINTAAESFKARKIFFFHHFTFHEQLKVHAQLSWARKKVL